MIWVSSAAFKTPCARRNTCQESPGIRNSSATALRRRAVTLVAFTGVPVRDVAELLGYSDIRLTLSTYAHVIEAGRDRAADVMNSVLQVRA